MMDDLNGGGITRLFSVLARVVSDIKDKEV